MNFLLKFGKTACSNLHIETVHSIKKVFNIVPSRAISNLLDTKTNVAKDVILYKLDNEKFFKIINIFAISQFGFWSYLSLFAYYHLKDAPVSSENAAWWRKINLGENKYRNTITALSFLLGWGILATTWIYSLRSVRYLILRKGGKEITIVTYTPIGKNRMFTLGLDNISSKESRTRAKSVLPLKVNGHAFHYVLDMKGEFKNPQLFDQTVGLSRKFKTTTQR